MTLTDAIAAAMVLSGVVGAQVIDPRVADPRVAAQQVADGALVVLTETRGAQRTALVAVDPASGTLSPLPAPAFSVRPPHAIAWDGVARHLIVGIEAEPAADRRRAGSDVLRTSGVGLFVRELGPTMERVRALSVAAESGDLVMVTSGPSGRIWRTPRDGNGGGFHRALGFVSAASFAADGESVWIAQFAPWQTTPTVSLIDVQGGHDLVAPIPLVELIGKPVVALAELPARPYSLVVVDDMGGVHLIDARGAVSRVPVDPPLPPGGAVDLELRVRGDDVVEALALGDGRYPYVSRFPVLGAVPSREELAGPLPGSPVDFAAARSLERGSFGRPCGLDGDVTLARSGDVVRAAIEGQQPGAVVFALVGASEQLWGAAALPVALPYGGCPLLVAADVVQPVVVAGSGTADVRWSEPAGAARTLFVQWLGARGGRLSTSAAAALHAQR